MKTIAFVGPSGTGKSHRAAFVAKNNGADAIIDDGLLISKSRVVAGVSAKKAPTRLQSVRQALFFDKKSAKTVSDAIAEIDPECVMILGTSDGMVEKIQIALGLPKIERTIYIQDIATDEEMKEAKKMRSVEGKHVIPVPEFEIKKDFSGYFMHPLRFLQKNNFPDDIAEEKTIMRPTFSYLGDYTISDNVIESAVRYEAMQNEPVYKVNSVGLRTTNHGAHIDVTLTLRYKPNMCIPELCNEIQTQIRQGIERNTAINVRRVHILVKSLCFDK